MIAIFFANSRLRARMELPEFWDCIILIDADYAFSHYLPISLTNPITKSEGLYNGFQIRTQNMVEWTFGFWKIIFPILFFGIRLKEETTMAVI